MSKCRFFLAFFTALDCIFTITCRIRSFTNVCGDFTANQVGWIIRKLVSDRMQLSEEGWGNGAGRAPHNSYAISPGGEGKVSTQNGVQINKKIR